MNEISASLHKTMYPICPAMFLFHPNMMRDEKVTASSGNRTRAARVAGEHSTTEPTMLLCRKKFIFVDMNGLLLNHLPSTNVTVPQFLWRGLLLTLRASKIALAKQVLKYKAVF